MTTAAEQDTDLKKKYTEEERDAMFEAWGDAMLAGDKEEADRIMWMMPIHPRWAKITAKVMGKEFALEHFNLTHADEVYGEGWLDAIKEK